ncbi:MAG: alpha-amylase [Muribaculaceae bacterium]|nr:alpha-amylase [Muribaculaceae bacterium]MDE6461563.1 alpha-amylase [Muribaculaceae bacterium]MDE6510371.1 alpha-amylase [Muribaculaceae bacterium]
MKPVIYQLLPRLFSNLNPSPVPCGTIEQNGCGKFSGVTSSALRAIRSLGATHVWFTGVIEHAHCPDYSAFGIRPDNPHVIKGQAGSPYAITDYYDVDPDLADNPAKRMEEFEAMIARTHRQGLKAIIDFVPNHVAREYHSDAAPRGVRDLGADDRQELAFHPDNNFYYMPGTRFAPTNVFLGDYSEEPARASGNDCFTPSPDRNDWYETVKLNYGIDYCGNTGCHFDPIPSTWHKMLHILRYWAKKGVDGFRCDMAHMVPIEFWRWVIPQVKKINKGIIFIAEIYDVGLYRPYIFDGGFDYLYDKVNLYDSLRGIQSHGISAASITGCWQRVDGIEDHMLNFLENHDEQRYASQFYAGRADTVLPSLTVSALLGRGAMMVYFGQELGEAGMDAEGFSGLDGRTTIFDYWSLASMRAWLAGGKPSAAGLAPWQVELRNSYRKILTLCNQEPAVSQGRFFDLMYVNYENPLFDPNRQYAFLRHHGDTLLLIAVNFADTDAETAINLPRHAFDHLGIAEGEYRAKELLSGRRQTKILSSEYPFTTPIAAHGAVIWQLCRK